MIYIGLLIVVYNFAPSPASDEAGQEWPTVQDDPPQPEQPGMIYVSCEVCGWRSGYESIASAKMGLGAHRGWCKRGRGRKLKPFG